MKTITLTLLLISTFMMSCGENTSKNKVFLTDKKNQIEVIDFYGTHRCVACKAIEANTKYTVDTYFENQKQQGLVSFKTVNVDDDKNYQMAEDYQAIGTALYLNVIKNGKETHINLTDFGFAKGENKAVFTKELKAKIDNELNKL